MPFAPKAPKEGLQPLNSLIAQHTGQTLRFPAIEIHGLTIWGLTLRMLRNFEALVAAP